MDEETTKAQDESVPKGSESPTADNAALGDDSFELFEEVAEDSPDKTTSEELKTNDSDEQDEIMDFEDDGDADGVSDKIEYNDDNEEIERLIQEEVALAETEFSREINKSSDMPKPPRRRKIFQPRPLSSAYSSCKIIRCGQKRRAFMKPIELKEILNAEISDTEPAATDIAEESDEVVEEILDDDICIVQPRDPLKEAPLQSSIDAKLGKCGTTVKKIRAPPPPPPAECEEQVIAIEKPNTKIIFYPLTANENLKVVKIFHQPAGPNISYTKPSIPNLPNGASTSAKSSPLQSALRNSIPNQPKPRLVQRSQAALATFSKIRVNKAGNSYQIVTTPAPETFPKAISYPQYEKPKEPERHLRRSNGPSKAVTGTSTPSPTLRRPPQIDEDLFMVIDEDAHAAREESPEPVKYVIRQDLLMSPTGKVRDVHNVPQKTSASSFKYPSEDLFVIDNDEDEKKVADTLPKNRRKATLVPKREDDGITFEEPPFQLLPRPAANMKLIENLARYRVLVSNMLKRLEMPPIDFNGDGDEYINMYKIFRN